MHIPSSILLELDVVEIVYRGVVHLQVAYIRERHLRYFQIPL